MCRGWYLKEQMRVRCVEAEFSPRERERGLGLEDGTDGVRKQVEQRVNGEQCGEAADQPARAQDAICEQAKGCGGEDKDWEMKAAAPRLPADCGTGDAEGECDSAVVPKQ